MTDQTYLSRLPSLEYLSECFEVDFEKGELIWKSRPLQHFSDERAFRIWNKKYANKIAGSISYRNKKYFYVRVTLDYKYYPVHQIIISMHSGKLFDSNNFVVDHIDRNPLNNSIKNLRVVDQYLNCLNTFKSKNPNHTFDKSRNKFLIQSSFRGEKVRFRFDDKCQANIISELLRYINLKDLMEEDLKWKHDKIYNFTEIDSITPQLKTIIDCATVNSLIPESIRAHLNSLQRSSKLVGVCFVKSNGNYRVFSDEKTFNGTRIQLGQTQDYFEAVCIRKSYDNKKGNKC